MLLFSASSLTAQARFSVADHVLLAASTAAMVSDWSTTIDGARRGAHELNPITRRLIGEYPSLGAVNLYFAGSIVGSAIVASQLPPTWRRIWLVAVTANGLRATVGNRSRGLRFSVAF
jgi:hypothetical protein